MLSICFAAGCASNSTAETFAADDCRALRTLFKDQSLNNSTAAAQRFDTNLEPAESQDKFSWPWGNGGRDKDKISKERAAMRKAHNRKTCAP